MRAMKAMVLWLTLLAVQAGPAAAQMFNVTFLHTPPAQIREGQPLLIEGNMIGADQVSIAAIAHRTAGESEYEVRELKLITADHYRGTIPADKLEPPAVEYYCYAVDFEGNRHTVFASEKQPQRVPVVAARTEPIEPAPGPQPGDEPDADEGPDAGAAGGRTATEPAEPVPPPARRGPPPIELATRDPRPIDRAPAMASVAGRQRIEAMGARNLADVLDQLPGISVSRSVSGDYRLALRGIRSAPGILLLLDGHRVNDLYSGRLLLEFPAEAIERVEVIRGPGSALYGTGAGVGAINVITRQGADLHADAAYGRFHEVRLSAGGGWSAESFAIDGQLQFMRTAGHDREVGRDALTGVLGTTQTAGDDVSNTPGPVDDERLQLHAQLRAALENLGRGQLELLGHYFFQQRGALVGKFDSLDRGSDLGLHLLQLDLRYQVPLGDMVELTSRVYFDDRWVDRSFQVIRPPENEFGNSYMAGDVILNQGLRESDVYQGLTTGAEVRTALDLLKNNRLLLGVQFEYLSLLDYTQRRDAGGVECTPCAVSEQGCVLLQGFELPCGEVEAAAAGQDRMLVGFYAQDHWTDLLPGLDLLAGFRLDYFTDFGLTFNPRVAVVYGPIDALRFKLLYAQAYRAPTFRELYDNARFDPIRNYQGNDQLDAVKLNTLEFGADADLGTRWLDLRLAANFFVSWIDDSIESVDQGTGLASWDNVESLFVLGTEVEGLARFGQRSRLFANASWFRAEVAVAGQAESSYITDVPQMRFNLGLELEVLDWLNLHLGLRYGSERRNNVRQRLELLRSFRIPAYTLVRAGLSTEPVAWDHLVFYAHAYNAFGHDHRDPPPRPDHLSGYLPRAGFTFLAGVAWRP